jgi:haloacetate dehalogenase
MMDDFETAEIETGETSIFVRWSGAGPPILLLHGFPQTHLMWRSVAPLLARSFTVVCADLRGYGAGSGTRASQSPEEPSTPGTSRREDPSRGVGPGAVTRPGDRSAVSPPDADGSTVGS